MSDISTLKQVSPTHVVFEGKVIPLEKFLEQNCQSLTLEITEECNLRCKYCCYDDNYAGFRKHGAAAMKFEVAKLAVTQFLKRAVHRASIGFYGGEPLLQFELINRIVTFVNDQHHGADTAPIQFYVTTNGTLLDDEKIHYLVEHDFIITVSLDGPKEYHDRYRVFRESGLGTFDLVKHNLDRFRELYPQYTKLGINLTISSPYNFHAINEFLKTISDIYAQIRISFVAGDNRKVSRIVCPAQTNSLSPCSCKQSDSPFLPFSSAEQEEYISMSQDYLRELSINAAEARKAFPLFSHILDLPLYTCHTRNVTLKPSKYFLSCHCLPGYQKLFCSSSGNYYTCEKVVTHERFMIGDVWSGIDVQKSVQIMQNFQNLADCVGCEANKTCSLCMAAVKLDKSGNMLRENFANRCLNERTSFRRMLQMYTEIMRNNRNAIDMMDNGIDKFFQDVHVISLKQRLH